MKVLQITKSSKGGAGIAAKRLHDALHEYKQLQSGFLSSNLTLDFENNPLEDAFFHYRKPSLLKRLGKKLQIAFFPNPYQKALLEFNKVKSSLNYEIVTMPFSEYKLHEHPLVKEADIIHLHWIGDFVDFPSFFKSCKKPIVWTLHDMNPFQGFFHYKGDEVKNHLRIGDLDNQLKQLKERALRAVVKGAVITPSQWLLEEAIQANFFSQSLKKCIPNAVDLKMFKIQDKNGLKHKYGIEDNEFTLLFVSDSLDNSRKGFDLLLEALLLLSHLKITIITIGKGVLPNTNQKHLSLGVINSAEKMAECYGMADAFVLPSREDNLPNVMLESFACGTPVVSFNHGGMKEHVHESLTGILAKEMNGKALAEAIEQMYSTRMSYVSNAIRNYAEDNFSFEKQAKAYFKIYTELRNDNES